MSTGLRAGTNNDGYLQVNGTDVLTALSSGNVGIGTSTPNNYNNYNTLTINGTNGGEVDFEINGTLSADIFTNSTGLRLQTRTELPIVLSTHNGANVIERLTLTTDGMVRVPTNGKLSCGAGDNLQFYYNGSGNYIDNTSSTPLYIRVNGSETAIFAAGNGKVGLNYDGSGKFETTPTGAVVTGILTATSFSGNGSALTGISSWEVFDTWLYGAG